MDCVRATAYNRFIAGQTDFNCRLELVITVESATQAVNHVIFTSRYDTFGNARCTLHLDRPHAICDSLPSPSCYTLRTRLFFWL